MRDGDHQPESASGLDEAGVGKKLENYDPRYYGTYYAIHAANFEPVRVAAGDPGGGIPSIRRVQEQKSIMLRCNGSRLQGRAEAKRFNRLLIDAGMIKGL